ncbi:MAG: DDE-type integrase/transposase/recombinase, partial [Proteobacteria bacterium]|nr:DDE-type integrase/transposase/recombinase [Pseudomonadota bacterium]
KMPTLIKDITAQLEQGHAAVVQLVSTSEALMDRRLSELPQSEWGDLNFDITPREYVLSYLQHSFPVQLYEVYTNDDGREESRPVFDAQGNPVMSREAMERRDDVMQHLSALPPVQSALDQILQHFGTDIVAEVTGRWRTSTIAEFYRPSAAVTQEAAKELRLEPRSVRRLVAQFRDGNEDSLALVPKTAGRRPGRRLLSPVVEKLIHDVLTRSYVTKQRPSFAYVYRQLKFICHERNISAPSEKAVKARLLDFDPVRLARRRHGPKEAQKLKPVFGEGPRAEYPLNIIQIDHTPFDSIPVDERHRKDVRRPYVTFAIDLYSRCIVGFHVDYEAPSATTVALCLLNVVEDKDVFLQRNGIEGTWPICGIPEVVHVDNGKEFHSLALTQGAVIHGIELRYRPPAKPWYGGTIESRIKRFMQLAHDEIPGTTRSNVQDRGEYQSEKAAALTLNEIRKWLTLAVLEYHEEVQAGIGEPPIERLKFGLEQLRKPRQITGAAKDFAIAFLPMTRRKLRRDGFQVDHFHYYSHELDYYIARRDRFPDGFEIRQDPRNMAYVWAKRPDEEGYMELASRNVAEGNIMKWEHKAALKEMKEKNIKRRNQDLIVRTANARREVIRKASLTSKRARSNEERIRSRSAPLSFPSHPKPPSLQENIESEEIKPFDNLEVGF